jgi:hypothetical protein
VTKLIYIGGFGRSGSTLIEYLLSENPAVIACGEVLSALHASFSKNKCTCGRLTKDCPVWSTFKNDPSKCEGWSHQDLTLALFRQLATGSIMVDSSKTTWGSSFAPFALVSELSDDFRLIHLVRDPRAVCWSALKKAARAKKIIRSKSLFCGATLLHWWLANLSSELFGLMHASQYSRVRYEELVRLPRVVISQLLPCGNYKLEVSGGGTNRHQLYGNRMRRSKLSIDSLKEDSDWMTEMPSGLQLLAYILSWPLNVKYGYR